MGKNRYGGTPMDFQEITEYRNTHNPYAARLGIVVEEIQLGYARAVKSIGPDDLNPVGLAHGGCYFSMADVACGGAMASHGFAAVTAGGEYHFFRSAGVGDTITAEAQEIKFGQSLCVYQVRLTDQKKTLLGTGTFTFFNLGRPIEL